jgi:hypothetical protein
LRIPLTFRLVFYSFRAIVSASLILFCAWLVFVPANAKELAALGAQPETSYPPGLRPMRAAKAIVAVAPSYTYTLAARVIGPQTPAIAIQFMMTQMAAGRVFPRSFEGETAQSEPEQPTIVQTNTRKSSDRDIAGPRFIKVD